MTSPKMSSPSGRTSDSADIKTSDNTRQVTVIAIDHNPILLEGIAVLIRNQPDMTLLGTAGSASEGVALHLEKRSDITVIDLELTDSTAFVAIHNILTSNPQARLIGLTTYEFDKSGPEALEAGAIAVVAKDRIGEDLVPLIRHSLGL